MLMNDVLGLHEIAPLCNSSSSRCFLRPDDRWTLLGVALAIAGLVVFPTNATSAVSDAKKAVGFLGGDVGYLSHWVKVFIAVVTALVAIMFPFALALGARCPHV